MLMWPCKMEIWTEIHTSVFNHEEGDFGTQLHEKCDPHLAKDLGLVHRQCTKEVGSSCDEEFVLMSSLL